MKHEHGMVWDNLGTRSNTHEPYSNFSLHITENRKQNNSNETTHGNVGRY